METRFQCLPFLKACEILTLSGFSPGCGGFGAFRQEMSTRRSHMLSGSKPIRSENTLMAASCNTGCWLADRYGTHARATRLKCCSRKSTWKERNCGFNCKLCHMVWSLWTAICEYTDISEHIYVMQVHFGQGCYTKLHVLHNYHGMQDN